MLRVLLPCFQCICLPQHLWYDLIIFLTLINNNHICPPCQILFHHMLVTRMGLVWWGPTAGLLRLVLLTGTCFPFHHTCNWILPYKIWIGLWIRCMGWWHIGYPTKDLYHSKEPEYYNTRMLIPRILDMDHLVTERVIASLEGHRKIETEDLLFQWATQ